jgi:hypothetical protein
MGGVQALVFRCFFVFEAWPVTDAGVMMEITAAVNNAISLTFMPDLPVHWPVKSRAVQYTARQRINPDYRPEGEEEKSPE